MSEFKPPVHIQLLHKSKRSWKIGNSLKKDGYFCCVCGKNEHLTGNKRIIICVFCDQFSKENALKQSNHKTI